MSKRTSSEKSSRKRPKLESDQAILDSYFRPASPISGRQTAPTAPSRQIRRAGSSDIVSDQTFASLESMNATMCTLLDGHGTQENPFQLDLGDEPDPQGSMPICGLPSSHDRIVSPPVQSENHTASLPSRHHTDLGLALRPPQPEPVTNYSPVAVDPLVYLIHECPWPTASPAPYSFLAHTLAALVDTRSRIAILNVLTNTLRCLILYHPASLLPALYLLSNSLSPAYSPLELGIGASVISKAIQHVSGLTPATLRRLYNSSGDPGDVAFEAKSNIRTLVAHPPLLIGNVYRSLMKIAHTKGQGAAKRKQSIVEQLLVAARGEEIRFLVRMLSQNLRVGAVGTSILTALARALVLSPNPNPNPSPIPIATDSSLHVTLQFLESIRPSPSGKQKKSIDSQRNELLLKFANAEALVKQVYVQHPNFDHIVDGVISGGLDGLPARVPLTVGIPLHPTLGSPTRSLDEIYHRLNDVPFTAEFKYDGQRAQIHASKEVNECPSVHIFSRHLEDMTEKYPDVVSLVKCIFAKATNLQSFIIDSEIVAIDPDDGGLGSFQELSNRARKDVEIRDIKIPVCVFAFDLMYLDGEIFLERSFRERRDLLRARFPALTPGEPGTAHMAHVKSCESAQGRECIEAFWKVAVESRCEGLMIKLLDSVEILETITQQRGKTRKRPLPATYEPNKRTSAWLKLKKDYVDGLGDTLDLVPVGAWHGNGRKAGWWSPVLLAVWDSTKERLVAVCKCMSGFSDAFYKVRGLPSDLASKYAESTEDCSQHALWECEFGGFKPDVYFKPREVWEIRGADVTLSPVSLAALGEVTFTRGLSLRFPRYVRVREDKRPEGATTSRFLAQMYREQQNRGKNTTGADDGDLMDMEDEEEAEAEAEIEDESERS